MLHTSRFDTKINSTLRTICHIGHCSRCIKSKTIIVVGISSPRNGLILKHLDTERCMYGKTNFCLNLLEQYLKSTKKDITERYF